MKANEMQRADGRKAYALKERGRIEWLTPAQVHGRNLHRHHSNYPGQWTETGEVDVNQVVEPRIILTGEARQRAFQEGIRRDFETAAARAKAQENIVKTATATKPEDGATTEETPTVRPRQEYKGIGMCALIRWCGAKSFDAAKTRSVLQSVGLTPGNATIHIQTKKGKDGENVPELSKELTGELNKIAGEYKAPVKAAPKPAEAKPVTPKPAKKVAKVADENADTAPDEKVIKSPKKVASSKPKVTQPEPEEAAAE